MRQQDRKKPRVEEAESKPSGKETRENEDGKSTCACPRRTTDVFAESAGYNHAPWPVMRCTWASCLPAFPNQNGNIRLDGECHTDETRTRRKKKAEPGRPHERKDIPPWCFGPERQWGPTGQAPCPTQVFLSSGSMPRGVPRAVGRGEGPKEAMSLWWTLRQAYDTHRLKEPSSQRTREPRIAISVFT